MASWLKAAEDLFEVVDRRAKLVAGEKPDELPDVQTPASNRQGSPARRARPRAKSKKRLSSKEAPVDVEREKTPETSQKHVLPNVDIPMPSIENNQSNYLTPRHTVNNEGQGNVEGDSSITQTSLSSTISNDEAKPFADHLNAASVSNVVLVPSNSNDEIESQDISNVSSGAPSVASKGAEIVQGISPTDANQNIISEDAGSSKNLEQVDSQSLHANGPSKVDAQLAHVDLVVEPNSEQKKHQEQKNFPSAMKVQEQLDEAQGLLNSAISTGQSKEARLARVCAGLQSRLQEYKSENSQLEELLMAEENYELLSNSG
ncbi:Golgin candidate 1 [Olea europaea subsp. europaea]|uniref:Golgin candidate 1 n=1 Tax=Olea europaea subsp. europaea TaxID=158383 RepID=A0A8S0USL9_OLEEU|nr:Golgin candidate 1 [Olea europaea subsp. europaea]